MSINKIRPLPLALQEVAINELNEKPEKISDDIDALKLWIQQQPHLSARCDDQFLSAFLRGCKFSLEKTKLKIDNFFTLKTKFPEMLSNKNLNIKKTLELLRYGVSFYLPTPLHGNGPRVGIMRIGAYPLDKFTFVDILKVGRILQEITLQEDDYANICGVVHILDMANVTAGHLFQMSPTTMKKLTIWTEQAMPLRVKSNHFINTPAGFEPVFNMIKPMLSEKQQKRLFVHGNKLDSLHSQIPQEYLPVEYGGKNGTIKEIIDSWEEKILAYQDYFKDEENYGIIEKLRIGQLPDTDELLGIEGSFRQLNCD